jgi:DNA-binding GntR family transcriptional regulator
MLEVGDTAVIDFLGQPGSPSVPPTRLTYREIADDLEARIRGGEYELGGLMPSYKQIADAYSVSISTAQAVARALRERGLTESVHGRGTFVVRRLPDR